MKNRPQLHILSFVIFISVIFLLIRNEALSQTGSSGLEKATHRGKVLTTMDSGGYTYVEFEENGQKLWAAAPSFQVYIGDIIEFSSALPMKDFHSKTLNKSFASIFFVNIVSVGDKLLPDKKDPPVPEGHVSVSSESERKITVVPGSVMKIEGGQTVEECYSLKEILKGKNVMVRGRVVKFTAKILGRNWIHIQDGTGGEVSNDLTVTTKQTVELGDLVLVKGKLAVDKDFGYGYFYSVIIENANLTIEENHE